MANKEHKTTLTLEAKAKGFDVAKKQAADLAANLSPDALAKGFKQMEHFAGRSSRQLQGMERHMKSLNQALHQLGRSVASINKMASGLDKAKSAAKDTSREFKKMGEEAERAAKRGSFTQGFLQQMGFGPYLQRGPGMARQAAGMAVGAIARSPFAGIGGLAQGVANIPGVGLLAGPMQAALQGSRDFLEVQQLRLQLAQGMSGGAALAARAAGSAAGQRRAELETPGLQSAVFGEASRLATERARERAAVLRPPHRGPFEEARPLSAGPTARRDFDVATEITRAARTIAKEEVAGGFSPAGEISKALDKFEKDSPERIRRAAAAAGRSAYENRMFGMTSGDVMGTGARFGINFQQSMQALLQMKQAGGTLPSQPFFQTALAAQTAFGVDPSTAAAFHRAQRQGGLVTQRAGAGDMLADGIADAMRMGLEQAEVTEYLQTIASGIEQFRTSGIPFASGSIVNMSRALQLQGGLGAGRAGVVAQAFQGRAQSIAAQGGPRSGLEFLMLQQMGGFQGGGITNFVEALERMRQGNFQGGELDQFLKTAIGSPLRGRTQNEADLASFGIQRIVAQMGGGSLSLDEARRMRRRLAGEATEDDLRLEEETRTKISRAMQAAPAGASGIEQEATRRGELLGVLKAQADIENQRLMESGKMIGTLQNLERVQNNMISTVATFAKEIEAATGFMNDLASSLPQLAKAVRDGLITLTGHGPISGIAQ